MAFDALRSAHVVAWVDASGGRIQSIWFAVSGASAQGRCDLVERTLVRRWGTPAAVDDDEHHEMPGGFTRHRAFWIDAERLRQASLDRFVSAEGLCTVRIEAFVPAARWLSTASDSVVPLSMIGVRADQLSALTGEPITCGGELIAWEAAALGLSIGGTDLRATVDGGRVVRIRVQTTTIPQAFPAVAAVAEHVLGRPSKQANELFKRDDLVWSGALRGCLSLHGDKLVLDVGIVPRRDTPTNECDVW